MTASGIFAIAATFISQGVWVANMVYLERQNKALRRKVEEAHEAERFALHLYTRLYDQTISDARAGKAMRQPPVIPPSA
jgi:hypothetical protein